MNPFILTHSLSPRLWSSLLLSVVLLGTASAQNEPEEGLALNLATLRSLKTEPIPQPPNLADFIVNREAALILGKALFWDMQVGSDGLTTCASCHFHAGADSRSVNTLSPAQMRADGGEESLRSTFTQRGTNARLNVRDFPFHRLTDPDNRHSQLVSTSESVVGSQGVTLESFELIRPRYSVESVSALQDPLFFKSAVNTRRVTPRNAPSVINAVFNLRNFWDGRAQDVFNGVNAYGSRDPGAFVMRADRPSVMAPTTVRLQFSSLASQAVAPPLSHIEMSAVSRSFPDLGKKLLGLRPLAGQIVHANDSVFRNVVHTSGKGLAYSNYLQLIRMAFHPRWWQGARWIEQAADGRITQVPIPFVAKPNQYGQSSWNFSLFFGLALQVYQSTLVSDDTPFDRYVEGNTQALTPRQIEGMNVFYSKGQCFACHSGPEFTNASVSHAALDRLEQMMAGSGFPPVLDSSGFINTSGRRVVYDAGFYNIGVRPSRQDLGLGANDPFGLPLSESRLFNQGKLAQLGLPLPDFQVEARRAASADGAFKTPSLRNVELTAPYFHNGGTLTLRQLVDFYNRRGDFTDENKADIPPDFVALGLTAIEKDNLVHFLKALTDERVRHHRAPFDHPQLLIPNGHPTDAAGNILTDRNGRALDNLLELPAAGRDGFQPLANFLNLQ